MRRRTFLGALGAGALGVGALDSGGPGLETVGAGSVGSDAGGFVERLLRGDAFLFVWRESHIAAIALQHPGLAVVPEE